VCVTFERTRVRARAALGVLCASYLLSVLQACAGGSDPASAPLGAAGSGEDSPATDSDAGAAGRAGRAAGTAGRRAGAAGRSAGTAGGSAGSSSAPCAVDRAPPNGALTIDVAGVTREYTLVLPRGYDGSKRFPVLFAWHGTGSNGPDFIGSYYGGITDGVSGRALIVAPTGLVETQGEYAGKTRWQLSESDGVLFDALLAKLESDYCIDTQRVFSTGHSIGAYFSNYLGCSRGDRLRGIAPISGGGPLDTSKCVGRPAVMIGHNPHECSETSSDCPYAVPWASTGWLSTQYWAWYNGCMDPGPMPSDPIPGMPPCKALAGCNPRTPVLLCLYDYSDPYAGPHAWPVAWMAGAIMDYFLGLPGN
jgi:polyhydroxybutyrate depolymerase